MPLYGGRELIHVGSWGSLTSQRKRQSGHCRRWRIGWWGRHGSRHRRGQYGRARVALWYINGQRPVAAIAAGPHDQPLLTGLTHAHGSLGVALLAGRIEWL